MPAVETLVDPAYLWVPDHVSSSGQEAAELAEQAGLTLDPEQRFALDQILAEKVTEHGRKWAGFEAAVIAARQNMKTYLFKAIALADIYLHGLDLVVWTAHEFNTAMEAFRDMKEIIDGSDDLRREVRRISEANGEEGFEFMSGQRLRFKARTLAGGRGLTGDRVILDEAFALKPTHMGALMPTMSAKSITGNPQLIYGSSAGQIQSDFLRTVRDRGRIGGDPSLVYLEWCAPEGGCALEDCDHRVGVEGCALDDPEKIRLANPALGRRISLEFIQGERRSLPPDEFARERLGWWDEPAFGSSGIPEDAWQACADREAEIAEPCVLAFDVAPGHLSGAIVTCGGALHVVEHMHGTGWLVERLVELAGVHDVTAIGFDPTGPAGALIPDLERAGFVVRTEKNAGMLVPIGGRESSQACEAFLSATVGRALRHRDQSSLNAAVSGAGRRQVGDSWKWSRRDSSADISPLVAATVARWLFEQYKPVMAVPEAFVW